MLLLPLFLLVSASSIAADLAPAPEDVSILFPLPRSEQEVSKLLSPEDAGEFGTLLPKEILDSIPVLSGRVDLLQLRAVGVRLDPCFQEKIDSICRPQVRVVWQMLEAVDGGLVTTEDAAIHSFYELNQVELRTLIATLSRLRRDHGVVSASSDSLGVHKGLARTGLTSIYAEDMRKALRAALGESRISRVTFMVIRGRRNLWRFGGFDVTFSDNRLSQKSIHIAGIEKQATSSDTGNHFVQSIARLFGLQNTVVTPMPTKGEHAGFFLKRFFEVPDAEKLLQETRVLNRLENPTLHTPDTTDCVSCHVTDSTRRFLSKNKGTQVISKLDEFINPITLSEEISPSNMSITSNFRAFGYFGSEPSISQRALNETFAVLQALKDY